MQDVGCLAEYIKDQLGSIDQILEHVAESILRIQELESIDRVGSEEGAHKPLYDSALAKSPRPAVRIPFLCLWPALSNQTLNLSSWVVDSQFATIRKLNGFARIRPGFARLLDIVRIALLLTASPAARIRNSH